jgi:putative hydrolase of the HAD superfamily
MRETRAVIFDLDDTLYPRTWFVLSGFMAVARHLDTEFGIARETTVRALRRLHARQPGREFQELCRAYDLPESIIPSLVETVRSHEPCIRLPEESVAVLRQMRSDWRIGILTNGIPATQRRKIDALGLAKLVDAVVFAGECGSGAGKPDPAAFHTVLHRLSVPPARAVFVGDDPAADIAGATRVGMRTILFAGLHASLQPEPMPDAWAMSMLDVPRAADLLVRVQELKRVA